MPCYNKGSYISQAIESVLMQKTHFKFQLLIIDDLSTDDSYSIAMQYQKNHPELIRIMKNSQNEGCLATTLKGYERIKSDYFCVLDPDDYWIDQDYLQNAIDFLESHHDHTIHIANTMIDREGKLTPLHNHTNAMSYDLEQIDNCIWGHTSGTIFRNIIFKHEVPNYLYEQIATENEKCFEGDSFRNFIHLTKGKAYYSGGEAKSVYRITNEGIWTKYSLQEQHLMNAQFYLLMLEYFKPTHPDFYIKSTWRYLLNYITTVYSTDHLNESNAKRTPRFDNLLLKCLKSFNLIDDTNEIIVANLNALQKVNCKPSQSIKSLMRKSAMPFRHLQRVVKKIFHA